MYFRLTNWDEIYTAREWWFLTTDGWYLKDRWDQLNTAEKGQLNSFRQALRDVGGEDTISDAITAFPVAEDWFYNLGGDRRGQE